ncbi:histidine phosphatase family protein [Vibrio intestinalis]|uniref:histidine phosphatase family protein n=1 Tax=Vibrio intestinalis TaxID=2933291 RepID=UPI0021A5C85F|nr:histidine phosphatase family protein [Vibrio intestinalis]
MSQVWVMRHGQTQWNCQRRIQGQLDSPLTEVAITELEKMVLPNLTGGTILCSDLGRSLKTAQLVAHHAGGQVTISPLLRERGFGVLQGEVIDQNPHLHDQWQAYHKRYQQPSLNIVGCESGYAFTQRLIAARTLIGNIQRNNKPLLLIVHGEWWLAFESLLHGRPFWQVGSEMVDNSRLFSLPRDGLVCDQSGHLAFSFDKRRA